MSKTLHALSDAPKIEFIVKTLAGIASLIVLTGAQATHWVPVATGPEGDQVGLYVDRDSLKGTFPVRTIREKFLNSYREQKLSLVEMNCTHDTWRTLSTILRAPSGAVLQSQSFPNAKSGPIGRNSVQKLVRRFACRISPEKVSTRR